MNTNRKWIFLVVALFLASDAITIWYIFGRDSSETKKSPEMISETMTLKVFFSLATSTDCSIVHARERIIPLTSDVSRAAIEELLKGPTEFEQKQGFVTNINPGVKVRSVSIDEKTVTVDFDKTMEEGMGGSCRVTAIQAQIEQTLKQFSSIEQVIISVEGKTEEVLQP